jgi:hypothetical protein
MADLINTLLFAVLYMYVFWCAYIAVMGVYRAYLSNRLFGITKILSIPLVIVGLIIDVFAQYTIAVIIFLDAPQWKEHLVTLRLIRYVNKETGWRNKLASYICKNLLDVFDPSGNHCKG